MNSITLFYGTEHTDCKDTVYRQRETKNNMDQILWITDILWCKPFIATSIEDYSTVLRDGTQIVTGG